MKKLSLSRKLLAFLLVFILAAGLAMPVAASTTPNLTVEVDGVEVEFQDQGPIMVAGGTVMVPVRGVFEHMGFTPSWDGEAQVATLTSYDTTVTIPVGGTTITINGETVTPQVPQLMLNDRIMLPLRAIATALGASPEWCGDTQTAHIWTAEEPEDEPVDEPQDEEPADEEEEYENGYPVNGEEEEPADDDDEADVEESILDKLNNATLSTVSTTDILVLLDAENNIDYIRIATDDGNPVAQWVLAMMYINGTGVEYDRGQADALARESAEQGFARAMVSVGNYYLINGDYEQMLYWWEKGAELGNAIAMNNVGWVFFEGMGVPQDHETSLYWLHRSAELGFEPAIHALETMEE